MRVAYVCADPGVPVFGSKGSSVHVQSIVRALLRRGVEVTLLATRVGGDPPAGLEGVELRRLPRPPKGDPALRERLALAANEALAAALGDADLVYERRSLWSFAALEAGVPSLLEVNAPLVDEQARHRVLVDRAAAEEVADRQAAAAGALLAVSDGVADHLRRRHPEAADRVHVLPNGVDPARFPIAGPCHPGQPFTVGFVGTLKPWHGLPVLVEAFARLRREVPDARLLIVGDGPGREELARAVAPLGGELTGAVDPADVPAQLARMDVAVAPYPALDDFYFSPLKVVEAMAAGLPVVASRVGQVEALLGGHGVLVEPGNAVALAEALAALARRPDRGRSLGAAARRAVLASRTWDAVLERALALVPAGVAA